MAPPVYPSDLNDDEWALLAPLIPPDKPGGRPRSGHIRRILNGLFYILRSGCAWRYLPREYGPWQTVYWDFPPVAAGWRVGAHPYALARTRAAACGPRSHPQRGDH